MTAKSTWLGRSFLNPVLDYLFVGGLLSVPVLALRPMVDASDPSTRLFPLLLFFVNMAHFSSTTVRLYARPENTKALPGLSFWAPLSAVLATTAAVYFSDYVGRWIAALFMTWAPYHYSRQAYGLSILYAHRSQWHASKEDCAQLHALAMFPFWLSLFTALPAEAGLGVFLPPSLASFLPGPYAAFLGVRKFLGALSVALPLLWTLRRWLKDSMPFPLIVPLLLSTNAAWLSITWSSYGELWPWVTVFHGLQYLVVITYVHAQEEARRTGVSVWFSALRFYGWSAVLSYALWRCWPYAYLWLGAGYAESVILVTAAINIHHFVVDAFIWSVREDEGLRKAVSVPA